MTAAFIVEKLRLEPHPEGGFYRETYRSEGILPAGVLPTAFSGDRNFATSIYFLIEKDNFSALHKIKSDETWHFYYGDALEVVEIDPSGRLTKTLIGKALEKGEVFQYTVKAGNWFGSRVANGGSFSLVGCAVAPGFDFDDFEMGDKEALISKFPEHTSIITELAR
jgi:predicted cupin superfamily sugar epimerase